MPQRRYQVLSCDAFSDMAERLEVAHPQRFTYHRTTCEWRCWFLFGSLSISLCAGIMVYVRLDWTT
jgi:hypothetical protein